MAKKMKCWEVFKCNKKECPVYKSKDLNCWLISETHCRNEIQGKFIEKMEMCLSCEVFKENMDVVALKETIKTIDTQFKEFREIVNDRDRELEGMSMELAIGLSEVFEGLKKISSGDPEVKIPETSEVELITKLKHMVNMTAENIGEIVDQFHEFAIGLAEHFDVMSKVSKGELNARISEDSQDDLLKALGMMTNQMIESISGEIAERKKAEGMLQQANEKLIGWMKELEERNRETTLLSKMGALLQTCYTAKEAYPIISQTAKQLFDAESGALYVLNASRNIVEAVTVWGESLFSEHVFMPADCWALRSGRVHLMDNLNSGILCQHLSHPPSVSYMCVPMIAHGKTLGMLYLQTSEQGLDQPEGVGERLTESKQRLAVTMAEQIAPILANFELHETLKIQSIRDPLTDLFTRRYMEESLEREVSRASRKHIQLGIIMIDIDNFKQFNDTFGNPAGDILLRELGNFLKSGIDKESIVCRYRGGEFVIILPGTSLEGTLELAEQLRNGIKNLEVQYLGQTIGHVTASLGVSVLPDHGTTGETLLRAADAALYRAKVGGRDQVVVAQTIK